MLRYAVAVATPHGAAAAEGSGTHWFAIGLLAGVAVATFLPAGLRWLIVVGDIIALGWSYDVLNFPHTHNGSWLFIAIPALLVGLYLGVTHGLRHLSDSEFSTRLKNIRKLGRWF